MILSPKIFLALLRRYYLEQIDAKIHLVLQIGQLLYHKF